MQVEKRPLEGPEPWLGIGTSLQKSNRSQHGRFAAVLKLLPNAVYRTVSTYFSTTGNVTRVRPEMRCLGRDQVNADSEKTVSGWALTQSTMVESLVRVSALLALRISSLLVLIFLIVALIILIIRET